MARALVTGCAGFIGSHLTEALLQDGHSVLGVDCFNDNYPRAAKWANLARASDHDGFELVTADLVDADVRALIERVRRRLPPRRRAGRALELGAALRPLHASQRRRHAAAAGGRARAAAGGASSTRPRRRSTATRSRCRRTRTTRRARSRPYGVTKLAAEHLCVLYGDEHGVDTVALRYFSVYGPRQRPDMAFRRFCEAIVAGAPIEIFGDGHQTRDFTYVADIVAATRAAAEASTAAGPRLQHRRRRRGERQPCARDARGAGRAPARRPPPRAPVRRRARHRRGHRRAPGPSSASRPRPTSRPGSRPSWPGCASAPSPFRRCGA